MHGISLRRGKLRHSYQMTESRLPCVDENGTKAAAETDIMIKETAMMPSEETYNFIVDKPFVYVIEDQSTGMILFMGRVNSL
jgi:serpin B